MASTRAQIDKEFEAIWKRFSSELRSTGGTVEMQVFSQKSGAQALLSTVVRVCPQAYPRVSEATMGIRRVWPEHYYYPLGDLHFTVLNCMPFLENPNVLEPKDIRRIVQRLEEVFASYRPFWVQLRGLNVFDATVFIQVLDLTGTIAAMRQHIRQRLANDTYHPEVESRVLLRSPMISYVNVVRFRRPVPPEFVDVTRSYREVEVGCCLVNEIELVTTDRLLSQHNTRIWQRYSLTS